MDNLFKEGAFLEQRNDLIRKRAEIDSAIKKLDDFLASIGVVVEPPGARAVSVVDAVRSACSSEKTGITKAFVLDYTRKQYPQLNASPATVAAALVTMSKNDPPELFVEIQGSGRRGSVYGIEPPPVIKLNKNEADCLMDEERLTGTGGWQSLFKKLQDNFCENTAELVFPDSLKKQIKHYCGKYGGGGYQTHLKKILGRHTPEIFS